MNRHIILIFVFILVILGNVHAINPDSNYILTPDSIGWEYEELRIRTEDNFELNTWIYAPNPETDKTAVIILAYPDAGNMSYFVYHAATLAKEGFTVVTFDYRGFGTSSEFKIDSDNLYYLEFSKDLESIVNNITNKFPNKKLGIWSLSMGTIITVRAYPKIKQKLDFIIGEGFVTNTGYIIDRYEKRGKNLILPESEKTYSQIVRKIDIPLLIIAAYKDKITTTSDALKLKAKLGKTCNVVEYEGEHLRGFQYKIDDKGFGGWYMEQISSFIAEK